MKKEKRKKLESTILNSDNAVVTVDKVEEMFSLQVRHLEDHSPPLSKIITFTFLTEIPRQFVRK